MWIDDRNERVQRSTRRSRLLQRIFAASLIVLWTLPGLARSATQVSDIAKDWESAREVERQMFAQSYPDMEILGRDLARAATLFSRVAAAPSGDPDGYWHASRASWLTGEILPFDQVESRMGHFRRARDYADLGLASNPDCAECMLWKFAAMGRLRTAESAITGLRQLGEMAAMLDRGISLEPTYRDNQLNSTLGNLHYSSAVFYRIVPDWFWVRWVLGFKGDKDKALAHSRSALALHPTRLDYKIELGTQLLCMGVTRSSKKLVDEGQDVMVSAIATVPVNVDDRREIHFAQLILEEPKRACGYSGDRLIDVDEVAARERG